MIGALLSWYSYLASEPQPEFEAMTYHLTADQGYQSTPIGIIGSPSFRTIFSFHCFDKFACDAQFGRRCLMSTRQNILPQT
jgi:hypothetical protein